MEKPYFYHEILYLTPGKDIRNRSIIKKDRITAMPFEDT